MASKVLSRAVMPVPPVVMMASAASARAPTTARTAAGSSRTMSRPVTSCPAAVSVSTMASPLVSVSGVRVSLIVRTKHRTHARASLRWRGTDTLGL